MIGTRTQVRPLRTQDLPVIVDLDRRCFGGRAWSADQWRQEAGNDPDREYIVLETADESAPAGGGGRIVGYGGLLFGGSAADVLTLAVDPDRRGSGYGALLLDHLLGIAGARGAADVLLEVDPANTAARALYRSRGFVELATRRHYYGPDQHAVTMRRELRPPWGSVGFGRVAP